MYYPPVYMPRCYVARQNVVVNGKPLLCNRRARSWLIVDRSVPHHNPIRHLIQSQASSRTISMPSRGWLLRVCVVDTYPTPPRVGIHDAHNRRAKSIERLHTDIDMLC